MAHTLVIDTIEAAGRSFSSGEELLIAPQLKKFIVHFRRSTGYMGEYGFDWLRDEYIYPIVTVTKDHDGNPHNAKLALCNDVPDLKKEYKTTDVKNPISPYGKDYYPAWLTMYPDTPEAQTTHGNLIQTYGVSLNLEIEELEPLVVDPTELIFEASNPNIKIELKTPKLYLKNIISNTPTEVKWDSKVQKKIYTASYILKIKCKGNLTQHEEIKVFAKLNDQKEEVGKLMVFKNANYKELEFDITPVRIVRKGTVVSDQSAIENQMDKGFGDPSKPITDDLKNLETYLNTQSLNQALLKANIGTVYDLEIDEAQWIADGLIFSSTKIFKDVEILDKLFEEFQKQHPSAAKNSGLISFLSPLSRDGAGGQGDLYDIDAKSFVIYNTNLSSKDSFAHEIGHVLGLKHSFHKYSQTRLNQYNLFVKQVDNRINYMFDNKYPENEIAEFWKDYKKDYADARGYLKTYYHYFKTKDVFKQATTENMMDYSNEKDAQKNIIQTNNNSRISFWKHQWNIMQSEITNYYSK